MKGLPQEELRKNPQKMEKLIQEALGGMAQRLVDLEVLCAWGLIA